MTSDLLNSEQKKRVIVVGAAGYIGTTMVGQLLNAGFRVKAIDRFFFGRDSLDAYRNNRDFTFIRHDSRYIDPEEFAGAHAIIDLSGIANDPACDIDESCTRDINERGCLRIAHLAKEVGARLIFSSSCSVYGSGEDLALNEESPCRPVSLYAKLKLSVEEEIKKMHGQGSLKAVMMRNATVYGYSEPRTRLDLIVNIMTAYAYERRKIFILGGGKQWRPLVHVKDVGRAFIAAIDAPLEKVNGQVFNVGSDEQNHRVEEVAHLIASKVPGTEVERVPDDADKRNYSVTFKKINQTLGYEPKYTVEDGIKEIYNALRLGKLRLDDPKAKTLNYYKFLIEVQKVVREIELDGRIL